MIRRGLGWAGWCVACLAATAQAQSPAELKLQGLGLERTGGTYVHASEAAVREKVDELKTAYTRLTVAQDRVQQVEENNQAIALLTQQAAYLKQEKNAIGAQTQGMRLPRGAGMMIRQNVAQQQQIEQMSINQVNNELNARKKLVPAPAARKTLDEDITKRRDEAVQAAGDARKLVDETTATYESLSKDAAVKAALAEVKKTTTDAIKLGPSKEFLAAVKSVDTAERLLKLKTAAPAEHPGARRRPGPSADPASSIGRRDMAHARSRVPDPQRREHRDQDERRELVARQAKPDDRLGAEPLAEDSVHEIGDEVELDPLAAEQAPALSTSSTTSIVAWNADS